MYASLAHLILTYYQVVAILLALRKSCIEDARPVFFWVSWFHKVGCLDMNYPPHGLVHGFEHWTHSCCWYWESCEWLVSKCAAEDWPWGSHPSSAPGPSALWSAKLWTSSLMLPRPQMSWSHLHDFSTMLDLHTLKTWAFFKLLLVM